MIDGPNKMVLSHSHTAILWLERRSPDAKPTPSFDCAKTKTNAERTICASIRLAGWDRSVAAAWKSRLQVTEAAEQRLLQAELPLWLKKRDACGTDAQCLADVMEERMQELR